MRRWGFYWVARYTWSNQDKPVSQGEAPLYVHMVRTEGCFDVDD